MQQLRQHKVMIQLSDDSCRNSCSSLNRCSCSDSTR
jgi:hypothetical protein